MHTLFISDLHLDGERPAVIELFRHFLQHTAPAAEKLYILGDLFEAWIGDDDDNPQYRQIVSELQRFADTGVPLFFMHGNRDFLVGQQFAIDTGCQLLQDPCIIDLYGTPTLLMHGDSLCTDDTEHQEFRRIVRDPGWQAQFLAQPLEQRIAAARNARAVSSESKQYKPEDIMDVNNSSVISTMREYGVHQLIHGHTHRPAIHELEIDGVSARRIVLGDWHDARGSVLHCPADGECQLRSYTAG
jgi:UDP-2,3-diacylglucosamine hydrolase